MAKLGTNIKHYQTMRHGPSVCLCVSFYAPPQKVAGYYVIPSELLSVCPSVCPSVRPSVRPSAVDHSCPLHNFDTVRDNFTKLGTNKSRPDDVQRLTTVTPPTFFAELFPFVIFSIEVVSAL